MKAPHVTNALFGPVPSRRLGRSLGIDVIPPKTCTLDCLYCESGPTTHLSVRRRTFIPADDVVAQLDAFLAAHPESVDALTFSSAGEPTLYLMLGELIPAIKRKYPKIPLVVLTNGTLLWDPEVRRSLVAADRVVPSLDAAHPEIFARLNRPHPSLSLDHVLEGLMAFRREYRGAYHLEVLLAKGINDSPGHLRDLGALVRSIGPDRVELNTVVRPPAVAGIQGLSAEAMAEAAMFFSACPVDVLGAYALTGTFDREETLDERLVELVRRRPCAVDEMADALGVSPQRVTQTVEKLEKRGRVRREVYNGRVFVVAERLGSPP